MYLLVLIVYSFRFLGILYIWISGCLRIKTVLLLPFFHGDASLLPLAPMQLIPVLGCLPGLCFPQIPHGQVLTSLGLSCLLRPSWNTLLKSNPFCPSPTPAPHRIILSLRYIFPQHWPLQTLYLSPLKMVLRVPRMSNISGRRAQADTWPVLAGGGLGRSFPWGTLSPAPPFLAERGKISPRRWEDTQEALGGGTQRLRSR